MLFQPRQPPFLSVLSVVFPGSPSVGSSEKSRFVYDEMRMQTWRWKELLQMLEVTTTGSHAGSQALVEVRHCLVVCDVCRVLVTAFPAFCMATFNSLIVLDFGWSLQYFYQHGAPDVTV